MECRSRTSKHTITVGMILKIVKTPTKSLNQRSKEIDFLGFDKKKLKKLIKDMTETMYDDDGIGLAAPQIHQNIRLCVIGKEADESLEKDIALINPTWEKTSRKTKWEVEGCLSVPNTFGKVKRYKNIKVNAIDEKGKELSFEADDYLARVVQHEVDHLDGILFVDKAKDIYEVDENNKRPAVAV